uniref:Hydroperoxide isomerase ALOXE3-like n=1 Tax=Acanthochromis polyacanthus TaxID=80966 RepID=A0A3Q1GCV7_9TELE
MVDYSVTVHTGYLAGGSTINKINIKLVGTDGESDHEWLKPWKGALTFLRGQSSHFNVSCPTSLGKLLLIELDKQNLLKVTEDAWFASKVEVKSPEGDTYNFPIYRWISDNEVHQFREGTALRVFDDTHHLGRFSRQQELKQREEDYRWHVYAEGIPHCIKTEDPLSLPREVRFSFTKKTEFDFTASAGMAALGLKGLTDSVEPWTRIDDIGQVFLLRRTPISEYTQEHWKEDAFFGYQYLNGVNPIMIQRCKVLPGNFPVTEDKIFLHGHCKLTDEMQKGNIYLSSGGEALVTILKRSLSEITYTSLCMPDDIAERGVEDVPNYYYRDDGLKLWDAVYKFVEGILGHYYKSDAEVQQDTELQKWTSDIFEHGFLSQANTGIPQSLTTVPEMVKFVTMAIFTGSGQHSAVNTGQYDYGGWMPNTPVSLQLPPPTTKGTTSEATMLQTLPDVNTTAQGMAVMWLLSKQSSDFVPLGQYPEEHFSEEVPCKMIQNFQGELEVLSAAIKVRNKGLEVPYKYMDPKEVENSVTI